MYVSRYIPKRNETTGLHKTLDKCSLQLKREDNTDVCQWMKWIVKMWFFHIMEHPSVIKLNGALTHATTQMTHERMMSGRRNPAQRATQMMTPFLWNVRVRTCKSMDTERSVVVGGGTGSDCSTGTDFPLQNDIQELGMTTAQPCQENKATKFYTWNWWILWYVIHISVKRGGIKWELPRNEGKGFILMKEEGKGPIFEQKSARRAASIKKEQLCSTILCANTPVHTYEKTRPRR